MAKLVEDFTITVSVELDDRGLRELAAIRQRLAAIERQLKINEGVPMSMLSDLLKPVTDELEAIEPKVAEKAHHLLARLNGKLDEEEQMLFAWVTKKIAALDALIPEVDDSEEPTGGPVPVGPYVQPEQLGDPSATGVADGAQGAGTVGDGGDATAVDSGEHIG